MTSISRFAFLRNRPWLIGVVGAFIPTLGLAAPALTSFAGIKAGWAAFLANIGTLTSAGLASLVASGIPDILWSFFALILFVWTVTRWVFNDATFFDGLHMVVLLLMTRVLMASFDLLTSAIWDAGVGIGDAIQLGMVGTTDLFFGPSFITKVVNNIVWPPFGVNLAADILLALSIVTLGVVSVILSALAFIAAVWGFWGYTLAKLIGLIFIPTLLYERLSFLFDGWLRFFFGFVFYLIIARLNLVLVASSFAIYLGLPLTTTAPPPIVLPTITGLTDLLGLFVFFLIGILALFSTARFASTLMSGAGGGGIGGAIHGAARSITSYAMLGRRLTG